MRSDFFVKLDQSSAVRYYPLVLNILFVTYFVMSMMPDLHSSYMCVRHGK